MKRMGQVLAILFVVICGLLASACTPEPDTRKDVLIVLRAEDGTHFEFSEEENEKEITIPADMYRYWDFDVKVIFPPYENRNEVDFAGTIHSFGVSYSFETPEGESKEVTSVHEKGTYWLRVIIPKDHELCKPYEIWFTIHVV